MVDKTLALIHKTAKETLPDGTSPESLMYGAWCEHWNNICIKLSNQMKNEGLENTANAILDYKVRVPS